MPYLHCRLVNRMNIPFHFDLLTREQSVTSSGEHQFPWNRLSLRSTVLHEANTINKLIH